MSHLQHTPKLTCFWNSDKLHPMRALHGLGFCFRVCVFCRSSSFQGIYSTEPFISWMVPVIVHKYLNKPTTIIMMRSASCSNCVGREARQRSHGRVNLVARLPWFLNFCSVPPTSCPFLAQKYSHRLPSLVLPLCLFFTHFLKAHSDSAILFCQDSLPSLSQCLSQLGLL